MKKALVEEKINSKIGIMKGKSFLDELEFVKYEGLYKEVEVDHKTHLVDNNESITPTTDKGRLDIKSVYKKLEELKEFEKQKVVQITDSKEEAKQTHIHEGEEEELVSTTMPLMLSQKEELIIPSEEIQFLKNIFSFIKNGQVFVKKYQYKESETSQVLRFGIDTNATDLKKWVDTEYNPNVKGAKNISDVATSFSRISDQEKLKKFIAKIDDYSDYSKKFISLLEKGIIQQAINFLDYSKSKTVLIDIFARHSKDGTYDESYNADKGKAFKTGQIKYTKDGNIETHTLLLYKQDDNILAIDPSNAEFSSIVIGENSRLSICLSKDFKIYTPKGDTGFTKYSWRDCIDIAVKLAFNLNKYSPHIVLKEIHGFKFIDDNSLKNNIAIETITNQQSISGYFPEIVEENNIRAKQSSDIKECNLTSFYIKLIHQKNSVFEKELEKSIYIHQKQKNGYTTIDFLQDFICPKYSDHNSYIQNLENGVKAIGEAIDHVNSFTAENEISIILEQ